MLADRALPRRYASGERPSHGFSSQCVEIITARYPAGALSVSPGAETETNMLFPSPSGRA